MPTADLTEQLECLKRRWSSMKKKIKFGVYPEKKYVEGEEK